MVNARATPLLQVRMPDELKVWLKLQAEINRRSLNGEVLHRLEQSRALQEKLAASSDAN